MRALMFPIFFTILAVCAITCVFLPYCVADTSSNDCEYVIVEEYEDRVLYMIENGGHPIYYYQIHTDHGDIYRIIDTVSMKVSVTPQC